MSEPKYKIGDNVVHQTKISLGPIGDPFSGKVTSVNFYAGCWRYTILAANNKSLVGCEEFYITKQ